MDRAEQETALAIVSTTTRVLIFAGRGFAVIDVRRTPGGWSSREVYIVADADDATAYDGARDAVRRAGRVGRTMAVAGASTVHARPMAMSARVFRDARAEVQASLDELFPIDGDGAAIGFLDRDDDSGAGYLLAIDRVTRERIDSTASDVLGHPCDRIIAPHQAALCFAGADDELVIAERGALGDRLETVVREGVVTELRRDGLSEPAAVEFPSGINPDDAAVLSKLAIASAGLDRFVHDGAEPLSGGWTPVWRRAMPVAAAAAVCVLLTVGALGLRGQRYADAIDRTLAEQETLRDRVAQVEQLEAEATGLRERLTAARLTAPGRGGSGVVSIADAVRAALPTDAFLETLSIEDDGVRLRGIAGNAREVLSALEASPAFETAREVERPQSVGDGTQREVFDVRVAFEPAAEEVSP